VYAVNLPIPAPFPVQPTLARHEGFLLLGSNLEVVRNGLRAYGDGTGLIAGEEYRNTVAGLPAENNGMIYVDRRFQNVLADLQGMALQESQEMPPDLQVALQNAFFPLADHSSAFVRVNAEDGYQVLGKTPASGQQVLQVATLAPAAVMAGILLPAVAQARDRARTVRCISNLMMIQKAKESAAQEKNLAPGTAVTEEQILYYLQGIMPTCPSGGAYEIGVIGEKPTCSLPGHGLP
jgi:hypothetical protein